MNRGGRSDVWSLLIPEREDKDRKGPVTYSREGRGRSRGGKRDRETGGMDGFINKKARRG